MVARASACHPEQLERLVLDELGEGQMEQLSTHLEDCHACRDHLERLAGGASWWQETRMFLSGSGLTATSQMGISKHDLHFLDASDDPSALGRLGNYEVHGVLGRGGMGIVLKALERPLGRWVAIKVLAPPFSSQGIARQRFAREAQAAAAVVHPNVMAIHRVEPESDPPYFVMPLVSGLSLQQKLDQHGALELEEVLRVGSQVADGLAAAHAQGLIHRDVKPANILLDPGTDRIVLTDFGLARAVDDVTLTCTGLIAGTPQYMSPEQARGESLDHRADLFSLGAVLYAMTTGRPPFRAESTYGLLCAKIADTPARPLRDLNPQTPDWLQVIVDRLLSKKPNERYETATQLAQDLRDCLAHVQQPAHCALPDHLRRRVQTRSAPPRWQTMASGLVLGGLALWLSLQWLTLLGWMPSSSPMTLADPPAESPATTSITEEADPADESQIAAELAKVKRLATTDESASPQPTALVVTHNETSKSSGEPPTWQDELSRELDEIHYRLMNLELDQGF